MEVLRFHDSAAFLAAAEPLLLQREAENCFFLGHPPTLPNPTDVLLLMARGADGPGAAIMTPGRHMMITAAPDAAVAAIADYLIERRIELPGIQGPRATANAFARSWTARTGAGAQQRLAMAIHELTAVIPPPRRAAGTTRFATADDLELVARWVADFRQEIGEGHLAGSREMAVERIAQRQMVLWTNEAGEAVAMAGFTGLTPNGVRVVLVYTPPPHRQQGYASHLVAALSRHLLDTGRRFCFLYTNLANPTSNKIYRDLGYRRVCESIQLAFAPSVSPPHP